MNKYIFESQRLGLRRIEECDAQDLSEIFTNEEVSYFEPYDVFTKAAALKEARSLIGDERFFAVIRKSDEKLIGKIYFEDKHFFGTWEIGYSFNRSCWSKGYATEAVRAVMEYAFTKMNVRRIYAEADVRNVRSIKVLEKSGMRREGVYVKSAYFQKDENGEPVWSDFAAYALLAQEWTSKEHN